MNKKGILIITFTVLVNLVFCQEENISKKSLSLSGDIGITTNGFSPIPTFSLGRPALQAHFLATKGRFAFRPMFAISDEGKLWYFAPWLRYKLIEKEKFYIDSRLSYGYSFFEKEFISDNNKKRDINYYLRYGAAEIASLYNASEKLDLELVYRVEHGLDPETSNLIHWLTLNSSISKMSIGNNFYGNLYSMLYYLYEDGHEGAYFSAKFGIAHKNFPLTLSSQFNQPLKTTISPNHGFVWNVMLTYSFRHIYN